MAKSNGTFNITGGEGIFAGATGTLAFSEVDTLSLDPTIPTRARATVNGSFQVVPQKVSEPTNITALIGLGLIGVSLLGYRRGNFKIAILRSSRIIQQSMYGERIMLRTPVRSSNLKSVGYDSATSKLEIEFDHGSIYQYSAVPESVYNQLMKASSYGRYFNEYIKGVYVSIKMS